MFKAEICPDTVRTSEVGIPFELTEKVDGQNLSFVNREDDLHIAQRPWVFSLTEIKEGEKVNGHGDWLRNNMFRPVILL